MTATTPSPRPPADATTGESFECPFCFRRVADQVVVMPALRVFELQLDTHMARGDQLVAS